VLEAFLEQLSNQNTLESLKNSGLCLAALLQQHADVFLVKPFIWRAREA